MKVKTINEKKERNLQFNLEMRNFLIKMIYSNVMCFKISYSAVQGGFCEKSLDKTRMKAMELLANSFENIEFLYITSRPGKKALLDY